MKVLYQDLAAASGAQASYRMLLQAMASEFPSDQYTCVCSPASLLWPLGELPNVHTVPFDRGALTEWRRLSMELSGIGRIARRHGCDLIWTSNLGPYVRTGIPQVLMVLNPFQVHPWAAARHHPRSRVTVAALRAAFRRSLRCCDAVQVETEFMGEYVRRIARGQKRVEVIPKAVEATLDCDTRPMSDECRRWFDGGLGRKTFTCLYVATCLSHKNHATVVAAIDMLRAEGLDVRLALSVTEAELQRQCDTEPVSRLVKSGHLLPLGWIPKEQLRAVYDAVDACVMPSHLEQLSSAHLEAMHWGKPQVCANLPYAHDLCGDAAVYADADDPEDWAAKIAGLRRHAEVRERLAADGRCQMEAFPKTWQEVAHRERAFLASVAGQ